MSAGAERWAPDRMGRAIGLAAGLVLLAAVLLMSTLLATSATSQEGDNPECGSHITEDTTLAGDLGPCPGMGLVVTADDVTLDLGGHTVSADNGPEETIGVRIAEASGVTVQNGTVEGFDAGVEILEGGGNTVQGITARDNVNDMDEPYPFTPGEAMPEEQMPEMLCSYGDGITTSGSNDNVIRNNEVVDNGPFGGITLVGESSGNTVEHNTVSGNNVPNITTRNDGSEGSGLCGATLPGAPGMQRGRELQAIGIRIEGPGASENVVRGNDVANSGLAGIAIHSYVCIPPEGAANPDQDPNVENLIAGNKVRTTGAETQELDSFADGISSMAQGPIGTVTCTSPDNTIVGNTTMDNERHGVSLHRTVEDTEVSDNVANRNGGSGVYVADEAAGNTLTGNRAHQNDDEDGLDGNDDCGANTWLRNRFGSINQECVATNGTGWVGGPGNSGGAPGNSGGGPGNSGEAPGHNKSDDGGSGGPPAGRGRP